MSFKSEKKLYILVCFYGLSKDDSNSPQLPSEKPQKTKRIVEVFKNLNGLYKERTKSL